METKPRKLPIGIQTFSEIREENYIYVDKTQFMVNIIDSGTIYFFARPRRFGKSLTVSTLDAMFSGKKELFKGLYAEEFMNRADYCSSPVIRLDMSRVTTNEGIQVVKSSISSLTLAQAERHDVEIDGNASCGEIFDKLIRKLYRQHGDKVVILIDEYDKPYTDFYTNPAKAEEIREVLRNFYVRIKANDEYIRFVFITGIGKFAKFGVFSSLNNIEDISMDKKYGEMCGLTEEEIRKYFPEHIDETAKELKISPAELLERMRAYYDGFCFDGIHRLYNPFSTLYFFKAMEFNNYWMESGTPAVIAKYLKERNLTVEQFRRFPASKDFLRMPGDMDATPPEGFLYQAGYLTIREGTVDDFALDYPNTEVLNAMSALLAQNVLSAEISFGNLRQLMLIAMEEKNRAGLVEVINALLASIPYDDFAGAGRLSIKFNHLEIQVQEWLYRSTILAFFRGCGVVVIGDIHTNLGRADLVISHRGKTYVIELKVAYQSKDVPAKLAEALEQMTQKNYLVPYPGATGLALVIDDTKRQITASKVVSNG
jgi:hypothetical protein